MDTFPFHWDTLDAPQCLRMACLCPDECHESWLCGKNAFKHLTMKNPCFAVSDYASFGLHQLALLICSIWLCRKLLCFKYLLATGSAAYHFRQRRSRHRSRSKRPPAAEGQALWGTRLKALLALDFCLFMRGRSCKPDSQYATTDTCRSTQGCPQTAKPPIFT